MIDVTKNGVVKALPKIKAAIEKKVKAPELSILAKVRADPRYTQVRSLDWFKRKINELGGNSPTAKTDLLKTTKDQQTTRFLPGCMFMFKYMPKHADTLPFYDVFPCTLIFSIEDGLVRGINWHYLPYVIRGKLFDKLWQIAMVYRNNQQQCKRITWQLLSNVAKFPEVRPAVKSYLYSHIQSKLIKIDLDDWKTAMLLPVESFAKKSLAYVARDSGQKIKNIISNPPKPRKR
jgi:hypothetical protein